MESWWETAIRRLVDGRRVILAGGVAATWTATAPLVRRLGAADVLVIATEGVGSGPAPTDTTVAVEPPSGLGLMGLVRFGVATLRNPPEHVRQAVERFDPDGDAVVLGSFLNEAPELFGRPFVSSRRPEWVSLEDKTTIDGLWDDADVLRSPSASVPVAEAPATAARIDRGDGTVWAVDATGGWHGGASGTRWVRYAGDADAAVAAFAEQGDTVRVMPFLEGIPCSIHGIVCDDGVVVLRPVEMVTLRRGSELVYAGCATYWDPPAAIRAQMRAAAARVGEHLRVLVGYRGAFTIDGVATADAFLPTELNPRPGAGLATMGRGLDDGFPLLLVIDLIAGGVDVGRSAAQIEHELLTAADAVRSGGTWRFDDDVDVSISGATRWYVDGAWTDEPPEVPGTPSADIAVGARSVRCTLDPRTWPVGPLVAPAAAGFYRHLDVHHGTSFGDLTAAADPFGPGSGPPTRDRLRSGGRRLPSTRP